MMNPYKDTHVDENDVLCRTDSYTYTIPDMAFQLLNLVYDTDDWKDDVLKEAIDSLTVQLRTIRSIEQPSLFPTFGLWHLLKAAYLEDKFEVYGD